MTLEVDPEVGAERRHPPAGELHANHYAEVDALMVNGQGGCLDLQKKSMFMKFGLGTRFSPSAGHCVAMPLTPFETDFSKRNKWEACRNT